MTSSIKISVCCLVPLAIFLQVICLSLRVCEIISSFRYFTTARSSHKFSNFDIVTSYTFTSHSLSGVDSFVSVLYHASHYYLLGFSGWEYYPN
jgi:hypothetical protein